MIEILYKNPILLLFLVSAIGYALGEIKIKGFSLGIIPFYIYNNSLIDLMIYG